MGNLGWTEILLIFLVILLVFGAKRIPEIARGLGKGIREFKDATNDIKRELTVSDTPPPPQRPQHLGYTPQPAPPPYAQPQYPPTPEQAPPPAHQPGAPPPPAPPTEGQPPV
jgi:sec-independent protein translocase protein TatA